MSDPDDVEITGVQQTIEAIEYWVLMILAWIVISIHIYKMYQDFCGARNSLAHKRKGFVPDKKDSLYKKVSALTLFCILAFGVSYITSMISRNFINGNPSNPKPCVITEVFTLSSYMISKILLYHLFAAKIYQIYGDTVYCYSKKQLACATITVIIMFGGTLVLGIIVLFLQSYAVSTDTNNSWPYYCAVYPEDPTGIVIWGVVFFLSELITCIVSIYLFTRPLNRIVQATKSSEKNDILLAKAKHSGYKHKVLVYVIVISTLVWLLFILIPGVSDIASILSGIDPLIIIVCVLLMSNYYPSDLFYERLCYLCILCCDRNKESYRSKASRKHRVSSNGDEDQSLNPQTIDTYQAIKLLAEEQGGDNSDDQGQTSEMTKPISDQNQNKTNQD